MRPGGRLLTFRRSGVALGFAERQSQQVSEESKTLFRSFVHRSQQIFLVEFLRSLTEKRKKKYNILSYFTYIGCIQGQFLHFSWVYHSSRAGTMEKVCTHTKYEKTHPCHGTTKFLLLYNNSNKICYIYFMLLKFFAQSNF